MPSSADAPASRCWWWHVEKQVVLAVHVMMSQYSHSTALIPLELTELVHLGGRIMSNYCAVCDTTVNVPSSTK
jgi:hypothetical protein